jgi:hypothetical protein
MIHVEQSQPNKKNFKMISEVSVDNGFIKTSFLESTRRKEFQNKWMSSDTWAKLIAKYCIEDISLTYNGSQLDKCLNGRQNILLRAQMDMKSNVPKDHLGIFRETLRKHGSKVSYYYYATESGHLPFKTETKWHENISDAKELLEKKLTRSLTTISLSTGLQQTKKRKLSEIVGLRTSEAPAPEHEASIGTIFKVQPSSLVHHCPHSSTSTDYWSSPEAIKLFGTRCGETTRQSIMHQIELLRSVNCSDKGYLEVIEGEIDDETLSGFDMYVIRQKCAVMSLSLQLALENMNKWTWMQCCKCAVVVADRMGLKLTKCPDTVGKWYQAFREKRKIIMPVKKKNNLPPILELNPDVCSAIKTHALANLGTLSVEMMSEYLHNIIIPQMVNAERKKTGNQQWDVENLLKQYGLTCISISTVCRWLKVLGFKYDFRKKGYYVDGHEKVGTVEYRWKYVDRYLKREAQMYCWIQKNKRRGRKVRK